jgi:hypothetical protein
MCSLTTVLELEACNGKMTADLRSTIECVPLLYYRMCSLTIECVQVLELEACNGKMTADLRSMPAILEQVVKTSSKD